MTGKVEDMVATESASPASAGASRTLEGVERIPRLVVSALSGGGGKTLLSLGLSGALRARGIKVIPFKKGPDYIDAAWLSSACARPASNIDPFFLSPGRMRALFLKEMKAAVSASDVAQGRALALVEGNRGLFDGLDTAGSCSTASLSRELDAPVVLSLNATKMTRTAAAIVQGVVGFEKGTRFAGIVLNQVGRARHADYMRRSIEEYTDIPVLGAIPRVAENPLPERHMGIASLMGDGLSETAQEVLERLRDIVDQNVDVDRIFERASQVPPLAPVEPLWETPRRCLEREPVIGYVRDAALWFFYKENLEALERAGARLRRLSLLDGVPWAFDGEEGIDAVYLGGGFPEDYLDTLSRSPQLHALASRARKGLPIYAECGGLMVLSRSITSKGHTWPMAGVLPLDIAIHARPCGLGYMDAKVERENPYHLNGQTLRGHEFHYSRPLDESVLPETILGLARGTGIGQGRDGILVGKTWGSYMHVFAPSVPGWAERLVDTALEHRRLRLGN